MISDIFEKLLSESKSMSDLKIIVNNQAQQIKDLGEKWENIPQYKCHLCKETIKEGRIEYMHKYFHPTICFDEYIRIIELPKEDYKSYKGHKIKKI